MPDIFNYMQWNNLANRVSHVKTLRFFPKQEVLNGNTYSYIYLDSLIHQEVFRFVGY